ncbi:MAG: hypothetical protein HN849_12855 [Victivallales bacterium]|nr:hypothetical protein [Victivallales bacterium]
MHARMMVLVGLVVVVAGAKEPLPDTVLAYRERFATVKKVIDGRREKRVAEVVEMYRKWLQELLPLLVTHKDGVEYAQEIQAELERLRKDPTPPKTPGDAYLAHLASTNLRCREAVRVAAGMHRNEMQGLAKGYMAGLEGLTVRLEAGHDVEGVKQAGVAMGEAEALLKALAVPLPPVKKAVRKPRPSPVVTVMVEAVIDGSVKLELSAKGMRWVCMGSSRVGIEGEKGKRVEVPVRVNGKDWRPTFKRLKRGGRRSDIYRMEGLGTAKILTTVLALRKGATAHRTAGSTVVIRDKVGPCRHVIKIQHLRAPAGQGR